MPLIRADQAPAEVVHFSLRDFQAQADQLIERARAEAQQLLTDSQSRAAEIERTARADGQAQGWRSGFEQGRELGRDQALAEHGEQLRLAVQALDRLNDAIESTRAEVESVALSDLVKLALAIAQRITRRAGLIEPAVLAGNLRDALRMVVRGQTVRITIHPAQRTLLESMLPRLGGELSHGRSFEIAEDAALCPGGCRIATLEGTIDADLQAQLDHMTLRLLPERANSAMDMTGSDRDPPLPGDQHRQRDPS